MHSTQFRLLFINILVFFIYCHIFVYFVVVKDKNADTNLKMNYDEKISHDMIQRIFFFIHRHLFYL